MKKASAPVVSFIILNYNTSELVFKCIDSIQCHMKDLDYEVLVVDNNSSAQQRELLNNLPDSVRIIESRQNLGFGGGNMLGANSADGEYLCFLNSDVELTQDSVTPLIEYLRAHSDVGCITPQQYGSDGNMVSSFNHDLGLLPSIVSRSLLEKLAPKRFPSRRRVYDAPFKAHHINGCFLLMPSALFWECGGFDMNIFLYSEEYDLAMRLLKLGRYCVVDPRYSFIHHQGGSVSRAKSMTRREGYISAVYAFRKYHNGFHTFLYRLVLIFKLLLKVRQWYILPVLFSGSPMSLSMRNKSFVC